ncbi:BMP family ABC transporter substrate-binding protein [Prauserella marina]|uniref:Ribose transport system substrate-binding protein n=1 Tax=Prauserella marina TaxID=530584 RepID=A0A222VYV8_9PSEU|nr:ABC transporter substrate-binding protein [Prauserella marina]ASR39094.1 BMP family ABC transporter substrate-binding protein [Prauserella marina]PWV85285.1 monosaccharide ABC transporter substrate-binding protein (CUT2 family) [Prauserella marina]SDC00562.1 ribose transport system substrate-binding protein [Prauserella marina]
MRMRKALAVVAGAAMALTLAACGSGNGSGGGDGPFIAIVSKGFQHQFWQAVKKGAEEEAAARGARVTFVGPPTEQDVEDQLNMLTNEMAKQPQAIGFAALDSRAAAPLLQQAKGQNIPVVAFDSGVDSDIPVTTVATDNKAAAAEAAKHMAEKLGGKGKVAMVVHDQTSKSGTDRRDGFREWMRQNAPGITVLDPQYGGGDQLESANITKSIISANPDLAGVYASNEGSAIGVIKGVQESGKQGITTVGFDSGKAQIDAINNGTMAGAVTQDPIDMGRQLVDAAIKAIDGEQLPKTIDTNFYWYDKTNIDDPKIKATLYQ